MRVKGLDFAPGPLRRTGAAVMATALAAATWSLVGRLIFSDRGLDLTDEGLYLLAARPPSIEAAWGTPFGWHTAPLFRLVGYSVADFRTLGAFVLALAAGLLGHAAVRLGQTMRPSEGQASSFERWAGAVLGAVGGLLYYGGLVRTPSYNWVSVVGATIAALGLVLLLEASWRSRWVTLPVKSWRTGGAIFLVAFGAFFSVPAKPTTAVFVGLAVAVALAPITDVRQSLYRVTQVTVLATAFAVLAVLTGLWSPRVLSILMGVVRGPSFLEEQSVMGATVLLARLPIDVLLTTDGRVVSVAMLLATVVAMPAVSAAVEQRSPKWFSDSSHARRVAFAVLLSLVLVVDVIAGGVVRLLHSIPADGWGVPFMLLRGETPVDDYLARGRALWRPALLAVLFGSAMPTYRARRWLLPFSTLLILIGGFRSGSWADSTLFGRGRSRFVDADVTILLLVASLGALLLTRWLPRSESVPSGPLRPTLATVGSLVLLAVGTGFGSGHGLIRQTALAGGIMTAAALFVSSSGSDAAARRNAFVLTGMIVMSLGAVVVADNPTHLYRAGPIAAQQQATAVGADGAVLLLEMERSAALDALRGDANAAGWRTGQPLIDVTSRWAPTLVWHLGATAPDSLMLTIGGYGDASVEVLRHNVGKLDRQVWARPWIMLTAEGEPRREDSLRALGIVIESLELTFPEGYVLVHRADANLRNYGSVELWAPIGP